MHLQGCRTDLPVILIYDVDPSWSPEDILDKEDVTRQLAEALADIGHPVEELPIRSADLQAAMCHILPDECLVLNWCEEFPGRPLSESQVALALEQMGFTFTGADSRTISLSENKGQVKHLLRAQGIPTPAWQVFNTAENVSWDRFPAIVKAAFAHCSYGITRESVVLSPIELTQRIQYVLDTLHQPALVEEFIDNREFHVGVIGNAHLQVLPPGEIDYSAFPDIHDRLCTYESNNDPKSLAYQVTAPRMQVELPQKLREQLEQVVVAAYRTVGCRDYARMDVRLQDGIFYMLDVNPNPDICADTSFALGAELAGMSYGMLGSLIVNLAAQRHKKFASTATNRPNIGEN